MSLHGRNTIMSLLQKYINFAGKKREGGKDWGKAEGHGNIGTAMGVEANQFSEAAALIEKEARPRCWSEMGGIR